jgi:hypothetical protein
LVHGLYMRCTCVVHCTKPRKPLPTFPIKPPPPPPGSRPLGPAASPD